jgi:hypothetical protein
MTLSLEALASWESAVIAAIRGATGTPDERDAQITRSGMYGEYPAIIAAYVELLFHSENAATRLEALKRAVFLVWNSYNVPSVDSGISELSESVVRELMRGLDRYLADDHGDDELRNMLAWYRDTFGYPFEYFGPVRSLDRFIRDVTSDEARRSLASCSFSGRGQLGAYWSAVLGS